MPFVKGKSGNPLGRPKGLANFADKIKALVGNDGEKLIAIALKLALTSDSDAVKMDAVKWLADRAFGKIPQSVELEATVVHDHIHTLALPRGWDVTKLKPEIRDVFLATYEALAGVESGGSAQALPLLEGATAGGEGGESEGELVDVSPDGVGGSGAGNET